MKPIIIAAFFTCLSFSLSAQDKHLQNLEETQELSRKVVSLFSENKISKSFEMMEPYWPLPENELELIEEKTIKYLNIIDQRFGKSIGSIKVKNESISDIASRETYFIRFEHTAIRLVFTYYRNNKGWMLNAFKWDDSFEEEFEQN